MIRYQILDSKVPTIFSIPDNNYSRSQKLLHIKTRREARWQNNTDRNPRATALRRQRPELPWGPRHRSHCWLWTHRGCEKYGDSQSPRDKSTGWNAGATHAVVASFVVLILGFYVNGEFRQKGTLWKKRNVSLAYHFLFLHIVHTASGGSPHHLVGSTVHDQKC